MTLTTTTTTTIHSNPEALSLSLRSHWPGTEYVSGLWPEIRKKLAAKYRFRQEIGKSSRKRGKMLKHRVSGPFLLFFCNFSLFSVQCFLFRAGGPKDLLCQHVGTWCPRKVLPLSSTFRLSFFCPEQSPRTSGAVVKFGHSSSEYRGRGRAFRIRPLRDGEKSPQQIVHCWNGEKKRQTPKTLLRMRKVINESGLKYLLTEVFANAFGSCRENMAQKEHQPFSPSQFWLAVAHWFMLPEGQRHTN